MTLDKVRVCIKCWKVIESIKPVRVCCEEGLESVYPLMAFERSLKELKKEFDIQLEHEQDRKKDLAVK